MRGSLGVVIGVVIGLCAGAAAMYLALRPPWGHGTTATVPDGGIVAEAPTDGGPPQTGKRKHKRGGRNRGGAAGDGGGDGALGAPMTIDDAFGGEDDDGPEDPAVAKLTDADRRLEWRGDTVAPTPQKLDMAGGDERRLDDNEVDSTVAGQASGVRDCVVQGATGTDLSATISIKMMVDGKGRVAKSRVHAPHYLFEHGLLACAQRALGKMHFPAVGLPTQVDFPISLN